jgi:hypothetical protein
MGELRRLARLARLAQAAGEAEGLRQVQFEVSPDLESDVAPTNRVRIIYRLEPEFGMPNELAELERAARAPSHDPAELAARKRKAAEEAAALARKLIDPKGGIL